MTAGPRRPVQVGTVLTLAGAAQAELASQPFDLVWVDLEHGALGPAEMEQVLVGAQATGATALVRIGTLEDRMLTVALDAGADGVVLAGCESAEEAAALVRACRYPPEGSRGFGRRRAAWREAAAPSVVCQVESDTGVRAAGSIAAVDGVDAVVVGLADLSFGLGHPLDFAAAGLRDAVAAVARSCQEAGCAFGVAGPSRPEHLAHWLTLDPDIVLVGTDAQLLLAATRAAADSVRHPQTDAS